MSLHEPERTTSAAGPKSLSHDDESRLFAAVREYQAALEAGQRPSRQQFLARYPDLAEPLADCLGGLELVHRATPHLHEPPPTTDLEPLPSMPVGDFRIVREIGRGGMGVVYEAVQLSLGRRVALKVLPFAATLDESRLQRFKNEAHAAAQLHHNNIVPVYATGCDRGLHYYAMQMIDGQPLSLLLKELRALAELEASAEPNPPARALATAMLSGLETPKESKRDTSAYQQTPGDAADILSRSPTSASRTIKGRNASFYRTVARLGMQAAEGLEHAHQMGVVHRDIKPANLLLDGRSNLWITDFGLALFHAEAGLTRTGNLIGTLCYMSPEQVAGDKVLLDHRTDVYSLGVTLYELLTLRPAFSGDDPGRVVERIRRDDPPPPRSFDRFIPAELETILLKTTAKNPAERYATAKELAEDLERFLKDRPIHARRPSWPERLRKWSRRHPSVVWAGVVVLMLTVAGLLVNSWMVRQERRKAQERAYVAEHRFHQALEAVDLLIRVAEEELADQPPLNPLHRRLLEGALEYYQSLSEERSEDPQDQIELGRAQERVRRLLADLTALQGAPLEALIRGQAVQDELELSQAQRRDLSEQLRMWASRRETISQESRGQSSEQRRQRFAVQARSEEAALAALLSAKQMRRLRQIFVQMRGLFAFHDPDVIEALQLTAAQRSQIRAIENEVFREPWHRPGPKPPSETPDKPPDRMSVGIQRVLEVLNESQHRQWQELTGEPFAGLRQLPFGHPPPRPR
jgi:eukaryotic-like serine/threonine-protein kinase